ncbi:MAG TPA: hypothetical protein VIU11_16730 [Nakamurella sp.]
MFTGLQALGVDLDDAFTLLEAQAVPKFIASWDELLASVQGELDKHRH